MNRNSIRFFSIVLLALSCSATILLAQEETKDTLVNTPPEPEDASGEIITPLSKLEFQLSIIVLGFGLVLIIIEFILIKAKRISGEDTIKFVIITLIVTSTLFLITAGYSNDQIAPAVGLLGTIAGYLLGKAKSSTSNAQDNETMS